MRATLLTILAAAGILAAGPVHAVPMHLIWTTYMRNYPSGHAMVIDEIEHDRIVDVRGCNDSWCQVEYGRAIGYIDKDALFGGIGSTALRGPLNPNAGCFWADQPAYVGLRKELFCGVTRNVPTLP